MYAFFSEQNMTVSYIVTVYNKAAYLPAVLRALETEQSRTGGEIILIDDGSTDGSDGILGSFAVGRPFVILRRQPNRGVAAATNAGFALASCPFVRFVDADDLVVAGSTEKLLEALKKEKVEVAFGAFERYRRGEAPLAPPDFSCASVKRIDDPLRLMLKSQIPIQSAAAAREAASSCFPLPEKYRASQDYILGLRLARRTAFAQIEAVCALLSEGGADHLSASKAKMYDDSTRMIADEVETGPSWKGTHLRYAARRSAVRARNYARRHLSLDGKQRFWLAGVRLASYLPFMRFSPETFRRIADTYAEALRAPAKYP